MAKSTIDVDRIKRIMLRKYPSFGSTISNVNYEIVGSGHPVKTAATDGKTIYVNADYMSSLPEDEQVFTMAHEVCHIALKHIPRCLGKNLKIWNKATDGVINQYLKKDGLPLSKGVINIPDALQYDAEELYQKLLNEQKQQKQKFKITSPGQQSEQEQGQGQGQQQSDNQSYGQGGGECSQEDTDLGHDSHDMWEEAAKQEEEERKKGNTSSLDDKKGEDSSISEKEAFSKNSDEKIRRAEEVMDKLKGKRRGLGGESQTVYFDNVGKAAKPITNWKRVLTRALEIEDEFWGHKFSDRASGYVSRIQDVEYEEEEKKETEIILDTSGSVSAELLRNFLRQVKTTLKCSKIKVGTFSNSFHGFTEIKKDSDIDELKIKVGGGTNFDAASRAFTKDKDVNKICFTDGCEVDSVKIKDKRSDIVWVSFENPFFKPDNGKVLFVPPSQINLGTQDFEPEISQ